MKTLLERLKPEVLQSIEMDAENYPNLISKIKRELEDEFISPLYLSVNTANLICIYNKTDLNVVNILLCFNE
jgi:hypothetical protein